MSKFELDLNDTVRLAISDEIGVVIGRAEYTDSLPQYLIRYRAADGRQVESWWNESALAIDELPT